jgi:hypothetical protein
MPGTLISDEGTKLPCPQFKSRQPHPSVDPLQQQALANSSKTPNHGTAGYQGHDAKPPSQPGGQFPSGFNHSGHYVAHTPHWNPPGGEPPDDGEPGSVGGPLGGGPAPPGRPSGGPGDGYPGRGAPYGGAPEPGPPGGGALPPRPGGPFGEPLSPNAYYKLKFKLEFHPSDLPEYDRSDGAFVSWTEDLDHYAARSQRMCEQLAFAATM